MNASRAAASRGRRVLSPRMLPPESALDGSTARTATRLPSPIRWRPNASMNVLLPTPGTPLTPMRAAPPVWGSRISSRRCASRWWSARVLSTSVIAFASARRSPARTAAASASVPLRADGGIHPPDQLEHAARRLGDLRPGAEHRLHAGALEDRPVPGRHDAADRHHDVAGAEALELLDDLRHERLVPARLGGDPDHVHVVLDRLAGDLLRGLEEHPDVDVEAEVGEGGRDHLGAAVVPVLAELRDQQPRTSPVRGGEGVDLAPERRPLGVLGELAAIDARDRADLRVVASPDLLERRRYLADGRACPGRLDGEREQVPTAALGGGRERAERRLHARGVTARAHAGEARDLGLADRGVVDL